MRLRRLTFVQGIGIGSWTPLCNSRNSILSKEGRISLTLWLSASWSHSSAWTYVPLFNSRMAEKNWVEDLF